jgi:chromosome partitioning related protein ParA
MKVISIISTKGGVGKTTLSANLAGYLSSINKKILMIDADPQPSLSSYFKLIKQADFGLTEVLFNPSTINHCISQTNYGDLIYSNDPDNQLQSWLVGKGDGRFRLSIALKHLKKQYDYVFIDTQGARGNLQDTSVLAADRLISPILPESPTVRELERGTLSMLNELQSYKDMGINVPDLLGIVYKLDRTKDAQKFVTYLKRTNNDKYQMLKTQIPQSVVFKEAASQQVPVTKFLDFNKEQQRKAQKSADAIKDLAKELRL